MSGKVIFRDDEVLIQDDETPPINWSEDSENKSQVKAQSESDQTGLEKQQDFTLNQDANDAEKEKSVELKEEVFIAPLRSIGEAV